MRAVWMTTASGRVARRESVDPGSVHAGRELAVVPRRPLALDEVQRDALGRLCGDHVADLRGQVADGYTGLPGEQGSPEGLDRVGVGEDLDVALEHHPAQLLVLDA